MNWRLSKPLRQLAAVSLLAAILAAVMLLIVLPAHHHYTVLNTQIEQERLVLALLSQPQANTNQSQSIAQSVNPDQLEPLVLAGESDTIRLANLQSTLGALAGQAGVQVRSSRNLSPFDRPQARMLGVQLQFSATIEQLQSILIAIESHRPHLRVEALQVTVLQDTVMPGSTVPAGLETRLDVMGVAPRQKG